MEEIEVIKGWMNVMVRGGLSIGNEPQQRGGLDLDEHYASECR